MDFSRPRADTQRDQYDRERNHQTMNRTFSVPTAMCDARQEDYLHQGGGRVTNVALEGVLQGRANVNLDYLPNHLKQQVLTRRKQLVEDMIQKETAVNLNDCGSTTDQALRRRMADLPKAERQQEFNTYYRITSDSLFVPCYKKQVGSMEAPLDSRSWLKDHLASPNQSK